MTELSTYTKFQVDILSVLCDRPRSGMDLLRELEEQYDEDIPHGRVYQNLNTLIEEGVVQKNEYEVSDRTHKFHLTDEGLTAIREYAATIYTRVSKPPGGPRSSVRRERS